MKKNFLICVDLEGVHGVIGEPYKGLETDIPDYTLAVENATKELNVVIKALFDCGATLVAVWDNHGSGKNLDFSLLDKRIVRVENTAQSRYKRMSFAENFVFDGLILLGYHARAGTAGVLAHTYSSKKIQYYKLHGKQVGEVEIDAYVAASYRIPLLLLVADDVCITQAKETHRDSLFAVTKYAKGRNQAEFIDENIVLSNIYKQTCACVNTNVKPICLEVPCREEIRFTRSEDAEKTVKKMREYGQKISFGEDLHTVYLDLLSMNDFIF